MSSYDGGTLKVTELFSKAILLPMFVYGDYMAVCSIFIHLAVTGVVEMSESTHLKGYPHTFVFIVYHFTGLLILEMYWNCKEVRILNN